MAASSLTCGRLAAWTLAAVLLQILGLILFIVGFFPHKPSLPGFSGPESYRMPTCDPPGDVDVGELSPDQLRSLYREASGLGPAYDDLVLMVIDGLPAEFILGRDGKHPSALMMEAMPYTQFLLSNGSALAYHAKAAPPTVTMPRLKAIVSGAIGGFLDVAFNFNTQAFLDDNLLDQFYRIGWKLVMLGDETWIKMFPSLFTRQDGVSSFFVKDTTEVDFNVSRHLESELGADDWSLLILHYLGLDHVGHIGGRQSSLMIPKLKEMDEVIRRIHRHRILNGSEKRTLLLVVSDHGMTDGGNHGGSSYEETDTIALFIGLKSQFPIKTDHEHAAFQVDIASTLSLLFGIPIPKNNIGNLLFEVFSSFGDEQKLRALQLNSWQLLRVLQVHMPDFLCGRASSLVCNESVSSTEDKLWCSFSKATEAHKRWVVGQNFDATSCDSSDFEVAVTAYLHFLRNASDWLSHRATDRSVCLLAFGVGMMLISCVLLFNLLVWMFKEVDWIEKNYALDHKPSGGWHIDEGFIVFGILVHVFSLFASSLVEEEQYTWHFLTSTLFLLFLVSAIHSLLRNQGLTVARTLERKHVNFQRTDGVCPACFFSYKLPRCKHIKAYKILSVITILICGRVLRGWHQGGVNWSYLPDISKWLMQNGDSTIKFLHVVSLLIVMVITLVTHSFIRSRKGLIFASSVSHSASALLVLVHVIKHRSNDTVTMDRSSTSIAQAFYWSTGLLVTVVAAISPWITLTNQETLGRTATSKNPSCKDQIGSLLLGIHNSLYLVGTACTTSWCLLQLLLQQPVNAVPVILLLLQLLASLEYFSSDRTEYRHWVEIAAMYFLGMAGHFGLGNSNSLATIDVAGAFIGISSHSPILSGVLMFSITYASPLLSYLTMLISISSKDMGYFSNQQNAKFGFILKTMIAAPCLLPLAFNSIVLASFTIVLLAMRNHLFVWSVFSPKYLYIFANTVSVYLGVGIIALTVTYTCAVIFLRSRILGSGFKQTEINCTEQDDFSTRLSS